MYACIFRSPERDSLSPPQSRESRFNIETDAVQQRLFDELLSSSPEHRPPLMTEHAVTHFIPDGRSVTISYHSPLRDAPTTSDMPLTASEPAAVDSYAEEYVTARPSTFRFAFAVEHCHMRQCMPRKMTMPLCHACDLRLTDLLSISALIHCSFLMGL